MALSPGVRFAIMGNNSFDIVEDSWNYIRNQEKSLVKKDEVGVCNSDYRRFFSPFKDSSGSRKDLHFLWRSRRIRNL
jgi:hypothetical protein